MALSLTEVRTRSVGNMKCVTGKIGFDSSFAATPGEDLLLATVGLTQCFIFQVESVGGVSFLHNYSLTAGKLAAFWVDPTLASQGPLVDASGANLSALTARFIAFGL